MNNEMLDSPGRLLVDLKRLLNLHRSFGIDSYPSSPELTHFLVAPSPAPAAGQVPTSPAAVPAPAGPPRPRPPVPARASQSLADIKAELAACQGCTLSASRQGIVFGAGNPKASLFIVGDVINPEDAAAGRPFSGEAGDLLAKMLKAIGLGMDEVYLTTVVKCLGPNRPALTPQQVKACLPFVRSQIDVVGPKVICTLGDLASQALLQVKTPLIRLRGAFHDYQGIPLMPTLHPAFLLKNPEMKRAAWVDLQMIQAKLGLGKPST